MAEIKSTMEMVLARAARMEAEEGGEDLMAEDQVKDGMRAGAAYMRDEKTDLIAALDGCPAEGRGYFIKGVAEALLRNINLPREDEALDKAGQAMNGLTLVGRNHQDLLPVFADLTKILDQYRKHCEQLKEQLEANFTQMMPQLEAAMAQKTGQHMKLQPSQHPKYQEEMQKAMDDINGQYGRAIDQHKQMVVQILTSMV
ncbi:MAG: DUF6657 family protein [Thermodesulfobacteriota bacterium]